MKKSKFVNQTRKDIRNTNKYSESRNKRLNGQLERTYEKYINTNEKLNKQMLNVDIENGYNIILSDINTKISKELVDGNNCNDYFKELINTKRQIKNLLDIDSVLNRDIINNDNIYKYDDLMNMVKNKIIKSKIPMYNPEDVFLNIEKDTLIDNSKVFEYIFLYFIYTNDIKLNEYFLLQLSRNIINISSGDEYIMKLTIAIKNICDNNKDLLDKIM